MSARPLVASVAPLVPGYDERSTQTNIKHVGNRRRGSDVVVTPGNSDPLGETGAASAQQELHWSAEVASKVERLSVPTSSRRRTDPALPSATAVDGRH